MKHFNSPATILTLYSKAQVLHKDQEKQEHS